MDKRRGAIGKRMVALGIMAMMLMAMIPAPAKAASYDVKDFGIGTASTVLSECQKLATKISKNMVYMDSEKYPDLYCYGDNVLIGVNVNPVYGTYADEYMRIANFGNKKLKFYGIKIGQKRSTVVKKLKKITGRDIYVDDTKRCTIYHLGDAGIAMFNYTKSGKLASWYNSFHPTSR